MKIRVLGAGIYGAHLTASLLADGHDVELHESAGRLFSGATGNIPARLHNGCHYPRSKLTRDACRENLTAFMDAYGRDLTRAVPINVYAIAARESLIDFGTYKQILEASRIPHMHAPRHLVHLEHIEGAVETVERHVLVDKMRDRFTAQLGDHVHLNSRHLPSDGRDVDMTIDATFCAHDDQGIDRFEACLTVLLEGPTDTAVTIMDGPFPSLYPWDEDAGLSSLSSAQFTPLARRDTWAGAQEFLDHEPLARIRARGRMMVDQMAHYYPAIEEYRVVDHRLAIRALPRSGADARLCDVLRLEEKLIRVRPGKIDAIFHAEKIVKEMLAA